MSEPAKPSISELAAIAFRRASAKVILRARQSGTPVIVWEDGAIRDLTPDEAQERLRHGCEDAEDAAL